MLTETEKLDKMQQLDLLLRHINLLLSDAEDALRVGGAEAIHQAENATPYVQWSQVRSCHISSH